MRNFGLSITMLAMATITLLGVSLTKAQTPEPIGPTVLLLGDSIAAGYGLAPEDALAGQLAKALAESGHPVQLINAGVSGDTTAGGLARIDWALTPETRIVIIILGGNDALRAIAPDETRRNLDLLLANLTDRGLQVLLTGMRAPPNLGLEYATEFVATYETLAAKHQVALYPFMLEGVAADPLLNQADGIHPNKEGVKIIVAGLMPYLLPLITSRDEKK